MAETIEEYKLQKHSEEEVA
ncbi:hypothetical protein Tco_0518888, partial [Tanacetum coccineum]